MKKKNKVSNFPCVCGHGRRLHSSAPLYIDGEWCDGRNKKVRSDLTKATYFKYGLCDCENYRPDNIKFLEQRARKEDKK